MAGINNRIGASPAARTPDRLFLVGTVVVTLAILLAAAPEAGAGPFKARTCVDCHEETAKETLHILLKYHTDISKSSQELSVDDA